MVNSSASEQMSRPEYNESWSYTFLIPGYCGLCTFLILTIILKGNWAHLKIWIEMSKKVNSFLNVLCLIFTELYILFKWICYFSENRSKSYTYICLLITQIQWEESKQNAEAPDFQCMN